MSPAETQPDETGAKPLSPDDTPKARVAFSRLKRELSDEDLASPGVQKMLLDFLARAEDECAALKSFQDRFHDADKRNGVLEEKLKVNRATEAYSTASLTIGAALLGLSPSFRGTPHDADIFVAICGGTLILIGILAKVVSK